MQTISITNQKGGVGKTTLTANLGYGLNEMGKRVLLVDLDPQANLSGIFGALAVDPHIGHVLLGKTSAEAITVQITHDLSLLPSSRELGDVELSMVNKLGRERLLTKALQGLNGYDYILIDCPPSLDLLTINALCYAKKVLIPTLLEPLSLQGLSELIETIKQVREAVNPALDILGVVNTKHNSRRNLSVEVLEVIKTKLKLRVYNTFIRENVKIAESPSFQKTVLQYDRSSHGARDYQQLVKEFVTR